MEHDSMMADGANPPATDAGLNPNLQPTPYPGSFRRRPIVVRDPKTGATKFVHGPNDTRVGPTTVRSRDDYMDFDEHSGDRAPVVRVVSGYRGKQIVVRDPARPRPVPAPGGPPMGGGALGVRDAGVRKASYFDRRPGRSPGYSPERYDDRRRDGRSWFEDDGDEDDRRMYGRGKSDYSQRAREREYDMRGPDYGDRYQERDYYRGDGVHSHEDLTGKVVYVDNLSDDVTTTGLADLFGMVGAVKELRLLYDRQGNPNGSADIVFQRRADAEEAIKSLDNVPLNNRPMKLSMGNGL
eukprot:GFKZ01000426.1.p1 GENE.GFKZ01000426.1~~GFKZ01000426.1.p1  ORF type:complete len:296 (-),score=48.82 GFKZ01000426.1:960-1847(-)